jgi:hypothetical protein
MTPEDRQTIVVYRLERAAESLQAARLLRRNHVTMRLAKTLQYNVCGKGTQAHRLVC